MNFSTATRLNQVAVETLDSARRGENLNNQSTGNANLPYNG